MSSQSIVFADAGTKVSVSTVLLHSSSSLQPPLSAVHQVYRDISWVSLQTSN